MSKKTTSPAVPESPIFPESRAVSDDLINPVAGSNHASLSFETALAELEAIVAQMENGQLPLEESLVSFKRGTELLQFCQKSLADIEQQVRVLNDANQLQPLADDQ